MLTTQEFREDWERKRGVSKAYNRLIERGNEMKRELVVEAIMSNESLGLEPHIERFNGVTFAKYPDEDGSCIRVTRLHSDYLIPVASVKRIWWQDCGEGSIKDTNIKSQRLCLALIIQVLIHEAGAVRDDVIAGKLSSISREIRQGFLCDLIANGILRAEELTEDPHFVYYAGPNFDDPIEKWIADD